MADVIQAKSPYTWKNTIDDSDLGDSTASGFRRAKEISGVGKNVNQSIPDINKSRPLPSVKADREPSWMGESKAGSIVEKVANVFRSKKIETDALTDIKKLGGVGKDVNPTVKELGAEHKIKMVKKPSCEPSFGGYDNLKSQV